MAHTFDTKLRFTGATDPLATAYTCGTGATLLVVTIVTAGATIRAGGAPTYNGVAMTLVYNGIEYATSPETSVDMYYLLAPPTGSSLQISVPNTTPKTLYCVASSYKAQAGYTSAFDVKNSGTGATLNPSNAVTTTVNGDVIVQVLGDGSQSKPTAQSHTLLYTTDDGAYSDSHQYALQASYALITLSWTVGADDWGIITGAWKEVLGGVTLVISDLLHAQSAEGFSLTQVHNLIIQELLHSQVLDSLNLIQNIILVINELLHSQTIENLILAQSCLLVIQELLHSQNLEGLSLSQIHNLTVQELLHSQTTENLILSQLHNLTVQDILHSQTVDSISLIQLFTLAIQELLHSQIIDNIDLVLGGITLIISDLLHSQNIEGLSLTQIHNLVIQEILHSQTLDNIDLETISETLLVISEMLHSQGIEGLSLTQAQTLIIQDMIHSQGSVSNIKNYLIFGSEKPWK